jgi:ABC-type transport system involved in multi-copper enzyme maturation permease subunit
MPVFEQSYPTWSPSRGTRVRWLPIVRRELHTLLSQRGFKILLIVAAMPVLIHLLQIYSVNKLAAEPNGDLARVLRNVSISINPEFFFRFIHVQMYFVFVLVLYASSGLVCDDIRLNLAEVYFSKPLTTRDYLLGKIITVVGLGLLYTALPVLFLFAAQAMMVADAGYVQEYWWVPFAAVVFAFVFVVPTALATLACSALTTSRRYAAAAVITLLAANAFVAGLLADILNMRSVRVISVSEAMNRVGESLFSLESYVPLAWPWALSVVVAVAAIGLAVLTRRVSRVEAGI